MHHAATSTRNPGIQVPHVFLLPPVSSERSRLLSSRVESRASQILFEIDREIFSRVEEDLYAPANQCRGRCNHQGSAEFSDPGDCLDALGNLPTRTMERAGQSSQVKAQACSDRRMKRTGHHAPDSYWLFESESTTTQSQKPEAGVNH